MNNLSAVKKPTWKRLCIKWWTVNGHTKAYSNGKLECVARLAEDLKKYLIDRIVGGGEYQLPTVEVDEFVESLPKVLGACNAEIYDLPGASDAYAFVHLIDRYRRTWEVLERLLKNGALPFHLKEVRILDVGAGPCASSWAMQDFYSLVQSIARESNQVELMWLWEPKLTVHTVERSSAMQIFGHWFSESSRRPGPFRAEFEDFSGISPNSERNSIRQSMVRELVDEWDYSHREAIFQVHALEPVWRNHGRYHLILFSNFLTQSELTSNWGAEIRELFTNLYAGGIACVIGGTGVPYPEIYSRVDDFAKTAGLVRIKALPECLPNNYQDPSSEKIKNLYTYVVGSLLVPKQVERVKELLSSAKDIWDSASKLTGPKHFGVRAYRTPNRKDTRTKAKSFGTRVVQGDVA